MAYRLWTMTLSTLVTTGLFLLNFASAELPPNYSFMHEATKAPRVSFYDYIIIGGGTAGIPLAATLSANYSVLLLERGKSPYDDANITIVSNFGRYFFDPSPDSPSQQFIVENVVNSRPKVLGGGTSINAGFHSRGEEQFNEEAKLTDYDLIQDSYEWAEKVIVFEPQVQAWQTALANGLVEAGVAPNNGYTLDHLTGTKVGGTLFDKNGIRHSAADLLQYANPEGLSLYLHATANKILFRLKGKSKPKAYGVVFQDSLGKKHVAYLKGKKNDEIVLAAGAIGSPQLLMLSGIGPKDQLNALNIRVVLDQPYVGKDMADNAQNVLFVPSPDKVEQSILQVVGITSFGSYIEAGSGFNFIFADLSDYQGYHYERGGFIIEKINGPVSKGELKIVNRDPADNPSLTFNYFNETEDLEKCVRGLQTILDAINTEAFSDHKLSNMTNQDILDLNMKLPYNLIQHGNTSITLEQHCRDTVRSMWHYHGGCHIGQVVDDDYKVIGVDALRVIDGSTLLNSPGPNPAASVLMLGRYMGVTILNQRLADAVKPYADS
ncbi:protein HOTHEAD-like [Bidens hawaiensis]|uniref:protein HOTHEAD-like n=1 Tax=Bidens hawaiensis TaxID=980011 RepID=UPI00404B35E6